MILLHNIGKRINSNYNELSEIMNSKGDLSFDGVYKSVCDHLWALHTLLRDPILFQPNGRRIFLFVGGDTIGGDNAFDVGMPREYFCNEAELKEMEDRGFILGWHTWSHRDLTKLSDEEVKREIEPHSWIKKKYFAYPYGNVDARVAKLVEEAGYEEAWSVTQGDGTRFQRKRHYLNW